DFQVICPERMDVAANNDRIGEPRVAHLRQEPRPRRRKPVPVLAPMRDLAVVEPLFELGHQLLLAADVPFRRRGAKLLEGPRLLRDAEIGAARLEAFRAAGVGDLLAAASGRPVAGETRAVLTRVEDEEAG